jgi:hypothetical protein
MDKKWIQWLENDLNRGCNKDDIITTLKDNNFKESVINKQIELYNLKKNKYLVLNHYHLFSNKLNNNFLIKKYKNDNIELFLTNNFLSENSIKNINKPNNVAIIDDKINRLLTVPIYETTSYDLVHNDIFNDLVYVTDNKITTWISLLIKEKTILEFKNIDKKFKLKQGSILLFSVFDEECNVNQNVSFKTSKPVYYKQFFKII